MRVNVRVFVCVGVSYIGNSHKILIRNETFEGTFCRFAALAGWWILYLVAKDEQGLLPRETIRGSDGSLFEGLEKNKIKKGLEFPTGILGIYCPYKTMLMSVSYLICK